MVAAGGGGGGITPHAPTPVYLYSKLLDKYLNDDNVNRFSPILGYFLHDPTSRPLPWPPILFSMLTQQKTKSVFLHYAKNHLLFSFFVAFR